MKKTLTIVVTVVAIALGLLLLPYFFAPVYQFAKLTPFNGDKLFNPYQNIYSSGWMSITIEESVSKHQKPTLLHDGYAVFAESKKIVKHKHSIPSYTHGFNFFKMQQLCIGSKEVLWIDLPLYQTTGHKQWVIDRLVPHNKIVVLENPGYSFNDLKKLSNYNLLEISNGKTTSIAKWDTALSTGHRVYMMADSRLKSDTPNNFTMIYAPSGVHDEIIHALKNGISYGVTLPANADALVENGGKKPDTFTALKSVDLNNDTLIIVLNKNAASVRFIHQGGRVAKTVTATDSAVYVVQPNDQYIRTEVDFNDGMVYYLNPVTRYSGDNSEMKPAVKVNVSATGWLRFFYFAVVALAFWYFTRKLPGKSEKKKHP